jgi:ribonucleoside-diphosphate reductase alpha chain
VARQIKRPRDDRPAETFAIPDSREGWVDALRRLIDSYTSGGARQVFDFSLIRPAGTPIRGFGGTASGPGVLQELLANVDRLLAAHHGEMGASRPRADCR